MNVYYAKGILQKLLEYRLDSSGSTQGVIVGFYEHGNVRLGFT
jgi:hypothetical protein